MSTAGSALLSLEKVTLRFGGLTAVNAFDLQVQAGSLFGIIGPNGAGKTTAFNLVTGVYQPTEGKITFDGEVVAQGKAPGVKGFRRKPYELSARGVARTFQNIRLFGSLTVLENVRTAFQQRLATGLFAATVRSAAFYDEEAAVDREARELLALLDLGHLAGAGATALAYG